MTDEYDELNKMKRLHNVKEQVSMRAFREALRSRYKLPVASDRMFEDLLRKFDEADRHRDHERRFYRRSQSAWKYHTTGSHLS
jgi:hypothetical protein